MTEALKEVKKEDPRIHGDRFQLLEHTNLTHCARIEDNVTRAHLLNPEFWSHVSTKITQGDKIVVHNDSRSMYAEFLVRDAGSGYVKVHILCWHELDAQAAVEQQSNAGGVADYRIEYKGKDRKHCVIRVSDSIAIHENETSKIGAVAWLQAYLARGAELPQVESKAA